MVTSHTPSSRGENRIVAAIGNFDGVHLGHRHLIKHVGELARNQNAQTGIVLFSPHPRRYFIPDDAPFLLTLPERRDGLLREAGVDQIFSLTFDADFAALAPEAFVEKILIEQLGLSGIVVGRDFRFGKNRAGDVDLLRKVGAASNLEVIDADLLGVTTDSSNKTGSQETQAEKISSTRIREAITAGQIEAANQMLGTPWQLSGRVETGQKLGRTLGFPTANLVLGSLIEPRYGVYAVRAGVSGSLLPAVANFGRRPTVGSDAPLLEVHLLDQIQDLYGQTLTVEFHQFLRPEQKFDGLEALKTQISSDCDQSRAVFGL